MSWNVEGLKNSLCDENFLSFIDNFDFLFFSETWAKKNDSLELEHYQCVTVPRTAHESVKNKRGHGGVCLFIRENISKGVHILKTNNDGLFG